MKVCELIAELQKFDPELDVCLGDADYDICGTDRVVTDTASEHDATGLPPGTPVVAIR